MKSSDDPSVDPPLSPLDRDVADAFAALDRTVHSSALDDFSSRVMARLSEAETSPGPPQPPPSQAGASDLPATHGRARNLSRQAADSRPAGAPPQVDPSPAEDSGLLHEIKALADSAKRRASERDHSESHVGDSFLLDAAQGGLRAVALPEGKGGAKGGAGLDVATASSAERGPGTRADARSSAPFWILGSVASLAAVAAVAVFVFDIGRHHSDEVDVERKSAAAAGAGTPVTRSPAPPSDTASSGVAPSPPPSPPAPLPPAQAEAPSPGAGEAGGDDDRSEPDAPVRDRERRAAEGERRGKHRRAAESAREGRSSSQEDRERELEADERGLPPAGGSALEPPLPSEAAGTAEGGGSKQEPGGGTVSLEDMLDEVAGKKPAPAPPPPTPSPEEEKKETDEPARPEKKELDRRDVASALEEVRGAVDRCHEVERFEGTVTIRFVVDPTGQVSSSVATGAHARTRTGSCVASAVKQARFKVFDGAPVSFTLPFRLVRPP